MHRGFFHILATAHNSAMNIGMHADFHYVFVLFGYTPRSGIARSWESICRF